MSELKPKKFYILALIALAGGLVFAANAWKSSLKVKQIKINGNRIVGTNEITQLTHLQVGKLLYKADLSEIQRNVMSHHYIKNAVVKRNLPSSIQIQVTERTPIAMVHSTEMLYLDEDGIVLPRSISNKLLDLPMISGIGPGKSLALGSTVIQPDAVETLHLLALMKTVNRPMFHNISEIQLRNGGDIILYWAEGGIPIIFGRGELAGKVVLLETFLNNVVRSRGIQQLQYVDLRFKDQIVVRWYPEPSTTRHL